MKVLFGVHSWGLGHATRSTVVIDGILARGHSVDIISTGRALKVLEKTFGKKCRYFDVPEIFPLYDVKNFSNSKFLIHSPEIVRALLKARRLSKKIIDKGKYDKVISDCRVDVYDRLDNSFIIVHQIKVRVPKILEKISEFIYSSTMKNYKYILVPDYKEKGLSGKLSHNLNYLKNNRVKYIGILSSLKKKNTKQDIDYFITLSGPEESRCELEEKVLEQAKALRGKIVIAAGNPNKKYSKTLNNIKLYSFVNRERQEQFMNSAKFIVARGGYTTIMDLVELDKKNILLIPSPKVSEHEYLAKLYEEKKWFHAVEQKNLDLKRDIVIAKNYNGYKAQWTSDESVKRIIALTGIK